MTETKQTYTVIGVYVDNQPVVAGVIEGDHKCVDASFADQAAWPFERWADPIEANDPVEAERTALHDRTDKED